MGQEPASTFFSHVKPGDTPYKGGGLRDFFLYRDLGIAGATNGKVIAHLVKANQPPTDGTGWHYHVCDFQIVIMMKGWAKFKPAPSSAMSNRAIPSSSRGACATSSCIATWALPGPPTAR